MLFKVKFRKKVNKNLGYFIKNKLISCLRRSVDGDFGFLYSVLLLVKDLRLEGPKTKKSLPFYLF